MIPYGDNRQPTGVKKSSKATGHGDRFGIPVHIIKATTAIHNTIKCAEYATHGTLKPVVLGTDHG